nr:hypothetical protein [Tanacetum cinerariifolium]
MKGILRKFSIARTSQQNRVAERRNRTLIEDARTMLADSKLPTTFWAEAVNTACYVQNRVCHVTTLNTIDHLGKFNGKPNEGFFVGYSLNSKAFRVFNSGIRIVEENLHIRFSEGTPNVVSSIPDWLFDIDALRRTMNYKPIVADPKSSHDDRSKTSSDDGKKVDEDPRKKIKRNNELPFDPNMPPLEDVVFNFLNDDEDDGTMADINNLDTTIQVSPIPTTRIHKVHPLDQEEPKKIIHALKIQAGYRLCRKSFYNSSFKKFGL